MEANVRNIMKHVPPASMYGGATLQQFHGQSVLPAVSFIHLDFLVIQCPCDVSPQ